METLGWRGISGFQELRVRAAGRRTNLKLTVYYAIFCDCM